MKRFRFRLQVVLDLRRRREEHLRAGLAEIQARLAREVEVLESRLAEREAAMFHAAEGRTGRIEPEASCSHERRLASLEDAITAQRALIDLIQREMDAKRAEVIAATQETRALERLRERDLEDHRQVELREEQKFLDELASIRSARQRAVG